MLRRSTEATGARCFLGARPHISIEGDAGALEAFTAGRGAGEQF